MKEHALFYCKSAVSKQSHLALNNDRSFLRLWRLSHRLLYLHVCLPKVAIQFGSIEVQVDRHPKCVVGISLDEKFTNIFA